MSHLFKKIILFTLVLLIHITLLFNLSKKSKPSNTFSEVISSRSVIKLTKVFVKADESRVVNDKFDGEKKKKSNTLTNTQPPQDDSAKNKEKSVYITLVKKTIEEAKSYPFSAKKLKLEGTVAVKFNIEDSGKINNLIVEIRKGEEIFTDHTKEIFETIGSFAPLPKKLRGDVFEVSLDIIYEI